MRMYRVGGYVRDRLMGIFHPQDVDYVVTGSTPEEMLAAGFKYIPAAQFPVFHDKEGNEWALARTEKSTGPGYNDFEISFRPDVTIEDDLSRRDLTINAMAIEFFDDMKTRLVNIIDPYGGQNDISKKILRHVSGAFEDDPVRVLRLARFLAKFGPEWSIADETIDLCRSMAKKGSLNSLTPERIWKELSKALVTDHPRLFFDALLWFDVLHVIFPEVYKLKTALESYKWHPEGNAYEHTMLVLQRAAVHGYNLGTRVACLTHDFGKALTPRDALPRHHGHDVAGVPVTEAFCDRLTIPSNIKKYSKFATRYHMYMHNLRGLNPKTIVNMLEASNSRQNAATLQVLLEVGICDGQGRLGHETEDVSDRNILIDFWAAWKDVKFADVFPGLEMTDELAKSKLQQAKIKNKMFEAKVKAVKNVLEKN